MNIKIECNRNKGIPAEQKCIKAIIIKTDYE